MKIRRVDLDKDLETINSWHRGWDIPEMLKCTLPECGFIVEGVAAGFIYLTDASMCLLEGFITNPSLLHEERDSALDAITNRLLLYAREKEKILVMAYTTRPEIGERAKRHGFLSVGEYHGFAKGISFYDA
jgi:hypothetical protein